ncbi:MAG: hypothetical protein HY644_11820 [Acidobacteria bacterium]|nr:hypothetical protein [Acidobacteriota bacterium]
MQITIIGVFTGWLCFSAPLSAAQEPAPDALKVVVEFRTVLQAIQAVLVEQPPNGMALRLVEPRPNTGVITTDLHEYTSGTLAKDHLTKIAVRPDLSDGTWEKVRYKLQVRIEPIEKKETLVLADAFIEALKRSFTGKEEWVTVPSNGSLEETFFLRLGRRLFGPQFSLQTRKKDFWQRDPRYVPNQSETNPGTVAQPDTKRW